jgi:hypothetical protein
MRMELEMQSTVLPISVRVLDEVRNTDLQNMRVTQSMTNDIDIEILSSSQHGECLLVTVRVIQADFLPGGNVNY